MKIEIVKVGMLNTNCYVLTKNNKCLIIDPGAEENKIIDKIDGEVVGIVITHHHFDHVGALLTLKEKYNTNVYDINNLKEGKNNIDIFNFDVIYTKGHTMDSITLLFDNNIMFTGDFIFKGAIGRIDLGGNELEMISSINKIKKYDDNIKIYPGHGMCTSLGEEKNFL